MELFETRSSQTTMNSDMVVASVIDYSLKANNYDDAIATVSQFSNHEDYYRSQESYVYVDDETSATLSANYVADYNISYGDDRVNKVSGSPKVYYQLDQKLQDSDMPINLSLKDSTDSLNGQKRKPKCAKCRNHRLVVAKKEHRNCIYKDCKCPKCYLTEEKRDVMKKQAQKRRESEKSLKDVTGVDLSNSAGHDAQVTPEVTDHLHHLPSVTQDLDALRHWIKPDTKWPLNC
ncbi:Doublesex- and mab-3-related transcription factor A1 [Halotydeus destructor]|nr:Doublesex- and mab-3-related transcription factor A1 [Halotydeus destructor]